MALQKQNLSISFAKGIDKKTDSKQVVPGRLLELENGVLTSPLSISKRNGYSLLGSSLGTGRFISRFQRELVAGDGQTLHSFSQSGTDFITKGTLNSLEVSSSPIIRNSYQQTVPDAAYHALGIEVYTWQDSRGGSRYSVYDSATGQAIAQDVLLNANAVKPKPMAIGQYVVILYINTSTNNLSFLPISATQPTVPGTTVELATNVNTTNRNYDACLFANRIYVAYNDSSGGGGVSLKFFDRLLNVASAVQVTGTAASGCITVFADTVASQVWVAWSTATTLRYMVRAVDVAMSSVLASTVLASATTVASTMTGLASNGTGTIYFEVSNATTTKYKVRKVVATNAGTVGSAADFLLSVGLAGKVTSLGVPLVHDSTLQPTYFLANSSGTIIAKWVPLNGGGVTAAAILPEMAPTADGYLLGALQKDLLTTISGAVYTSTGVTVARFTTSPTQAPHTAELGLNLHIGGGMLYAYDGVSVVEHGFHLFPENVTGVLAGSGGSLSAGSYQYAVTYEWTDNQGQIHRSAPSIALSKTAVANDKCTLTIPTLRITAKTGTRSPVEVVVYRTQANLPVFYRVTSVTSPLLNDPTADTVSYVDSASDASILGNALLYTTGGVIENIAAPAPYAMTTFKDRVVLVPSEARNSYWLSKGLIQGTPVAFSDSFSYPIPQAGGNTVAVAQMDEKLVFFKEAGIAVAVGEGPVNTGVQGGLSAPQLLPAATGCKSRNSVVLVPDGLMYQTQQGIYLLDRSLQVSYIGLDVDSYKDETVLSATLVPNTTQVRFIMSSGTALVYDYLMQQWSTFSNHTGVGAVAFQNLFTFLSPTGIVSQETPGTFTDRGAFIKLKVKTGWLSLAGLQGFQRLYRILILGTFKSSHRLRYGLAYDFNTSVTQQNYLDATGLTGDVYGEDATYGDSTPYGGTFPLYQFQINPAQQKCQSIQLTLEDTQTSDYGEGMSLSAFGLLAGVKGGLNRVPGSRRSR